MRMRVNGDQRNLEAFVADSEDRVPAFGESGLSIDSQTLDFYSSTRTHVQFWSSIAE